MNHFLDVGSNTGQTFDWFLSKTNEYDGWNVWCFEPSPRNMAGLIGAAKAYEHRYKITICPFGLSGEIGASKFYEKSDNKADSFLHDLVCDGHGLIPNVHSGYSVLAATTTLSQFVSDNIAANDRMEIKLDCEGMENRILADILRHPHLLKAITRIYVEWHPKPDDGLMKEFASHGLILELWPY